MEYWKEDRGREGEREGRGRDVLLDVYVKQNGCSVSSVASSTGLEKAEERKRVEELPSVQDGKKRKKREREKKC